MGGASIGVPAEEGLSISSQGHRGRAPPSHARVAEMATAASWRGRPIISFRAGRDPRRPPKTRLDLRIGFDEMGGPDRQGRDFTRLVPRCGLAAYKGLAQGRKRLGPRSHGELEGSGRARGFSWRSAPNLRLRIPAARPSAPPKAGTWTIQKGVGGGGGTRPLQREDAAQNVLR